MKEFLRKNPVTMNDWLNFHPYPQHSDADSYFLKLCNQLLKENIDQPLLLDTLNWEEYKDLTCVLVCYFEDITSETNIWRSFITEHKRLYGKYLPFHDTTVDYYDDEINPQDIKFLVWHFISMQYEGRMINPLHDFISSFSINTFKLLESEYETAPHNNPLKDFLVVPTHKDVYNTRAIMEFLTLNSYLNHHFFQKEIEKGYAEIAERKFKPEHEHILQYNFKVELYFNCASPILALRANEQLAHIIGENHPRYHEIKNISKRLNFKCIVKGNDRTYLDLEHIATRKIIKLSLESLDPFNKKSKLSKGKRLSANMVNWGGDWLLMGSMRIFNLWEPTGNTDDEKHLFDPLEPKLEMLEYHEECFRDLAGGGVLAYFQNTKQYTEFMNRYMVYIFQKANPEKPIPSDIGKLVFEDEEMEDLVLFFNHHAGTEMYTGLATAVKDRRNPYYKPKETTNIQSLITDKSVSAEFVKYLMDHKMITFNRNKNYDNKIIVDNLDFLSRYFKQEEYFSEPRIEIVNS